MRNPPAAARAAAALLIPAALVLGLASDLVPVPAAAAGAPGERAVREGIERTFAIMLDALRVGDAEALADCYTEDARLIGPGRPVVQGRPAIIAQMQYVIDMGIRHVDTRIDEIFPGEDSAVEIGSATFYNAMHRPVSNVSFISVWKKEGGRWRIHRDLVTL